MSPTFKEILKSPLFNFEVGQVSENGTGTFYKVHVEAIAQLSQPLHDMVKGDCAVIETAWPAVSRRTFERLVQFAYTGDYTIPKPPRRRVAVNEEEAVENETSSNTLNEVHAVEESGGLPVDDVPTVEAPVEEYIEPAAANPTHRWDGGWGEVTKPAPDEPVEEIAESIASWGYHRPTTKKKKKGHIVPIPPPEPEPAPEQTGFASLTFDLLAPRDNYKDTCEPSEHFIAERNYFKLFLSHAKLWAVADKYDIDSLKALALYKLHKTLCVFEISSENAADVINLVRYVYSAECGAQADEKLKDLAAQYTAFNSAALAHDSNFMELLREGGQFVEDFLKLVMQRV
ncbi:hypothetical protein ACLOAV_009463 [Pseudogymnoascus australis]